MQGIKYLSIREITPSTTDWRVKVLVLDKTNAYTSEGGRRTQKVLLQDNQGNKIEGIMWDNTIEVLKQTLQPFSMYIIGGAKVQPIKPSFLHASPGMTLQWVFMPSTYIRPMPETEEGIPYPPIEIAPLADVRALAGTKTMIDIIAVVVEIKPPKEREVKSRVVQLQEFTITDRELKPIMLTMWGEFLNNQGAQIYAHKESMPIIVCRGLTATAFSGGSLSTVPFSYVTLDPDIPQVNELRSWVVDNQKAIRGINQQITYSYLEAIKDNTKTIQITDICVIQPDTKNVHIKGSMSIPDLLQKVQYSNCPKCSQTTEAHANEQFQCNTCNTEQIATSRCKLMVELEDATATIPATLFDKATEKLLEQTADQLQKVNEEGMKTLLARTNRALRAQKLILEIRATKKKFTDKKTRYTVQDWIQADKNPETATRKKEGTKDYGSTPDKEEPNRIRAAPQQTPEPDSRRKDKQLCEDTETTPMKKVKLEFVQKNTTTNNPQSE